jgi:transcriptional regulator with XRE-family HTH domain
METLKIELLAQRLRERRAGKGVRDAAAEARVSPATFSRIENGKVPDLETFSRVCRWLEDDPATYLGISVASTASPPTARVHFKKGTAIRPDSAIALGDLIIATQAALMKEEELEG